MENKKNTCKGLFYRATESSYINSRDEYIHQIKMTPLKRKSCPGCEYCENLKDLLSEDIPQENGPIIEDEDDPGTLYELGVEVFGEEDFSTKFYKKEEIQ